MIKKVTFLWIIATMLLAISTQAQDVRETFRKSHEATPMISDKPEPLKGVRKKMTAQELQAAKNKGDKRTLSMQRNFTPRRNANAFATEPSAVNVPFEANFSKSEEVMDDFIIINNNEDTSDGEPCTWKWSSGNGAYYIYNMDGQTAADDYLVLPINLEKGKNYEITVNAATWGYPEEFEVVVGTECSASALTTTIIEKTIPEDEAADYTGTFSPAADGLYYIAIHVISPADLYLLSIYKFAVDFVADPAAPVAVSDFTVEQVPEQLKNIVKFTAPALSIGGDELTDNVTIEIRRNDEVIATIADVAPGSQQSYTDEVEAEGTYYYQIITHNNAGKGRKSEIVSVRVSMPQDIPYVANFADADVFDKFQVIDNNNDGSTWNHDSYNGVAAYQYNWDNNGDDYLVSQPLRLEAGKNYEVTIHAAESSEFNIERFEVVAGKNATAEDLNIMVIEPTEIASTAFSEFTGSFTAEESGIYYVAIHAISDADQFYLYVSDFSVEKGPEATAPAAPTLTGTAAAEGALSATIQVTAPTQCANGTPLAAISKVELYRDNELIGQQEDVTPGAVLDFADDTILASGIYYYHAVAYNESGNGVKSEKLPLYVGIDQPGAPENVEAVDHGTTIDFSWDAVTTGMNGGYINPDNITYEVWKLDVSPFFVFFQDKLASVIGQTSATAEYNTDEGEEQDYTYFAVRTTNESTDNEDNAAWNYTYLFTGKPYELPLTEGFADSELHYFWESNGVLLTANYDSDGDGTAMALAAETPGNVFFISGKLNLKDANDPKLVFSTLSPNISQLYILGDVDGQDNWNLLETINLTDEDYQCHQISLSALKNHERFARIAFMAQYKTAATIDEEGYITDYGDLIFIDDIRIGDFLNNNLAINVYAPESVSAGDTASIIVMVENIGLQAASNYTVTVKAGESELLNETVTEELPSFSKNQFYTELLTTIFDEAGDVAVTVTVDYAADNDTSDNSITGAITIVEPDAAAPENLTAAENATGVELGWTAPVAVPEEYTEDFETSPGEFTQIDADDDGYGWVYMNDDELMSHSGTGGLQSYSYVPNVGAVHVDNWLVTPLAILDGTFSFWASAQDGDWIDEHFAVYVSTKGNESVADFEQVSEEFVATGHSTEYTADLSSYAGQTGYIAIRHFNSYDQFAMVVDDISFTKAPAVPISFNIYMDRQLIATVEGDNTTYTVEADKLTEGEHTFAVTAVYTNGKESKPTTAVFTVESDIRQIATDGKPVDVYSIDGRLLRRQATSLEGLKGVYIVNGKAVMVK